MSPPQASQREAGRAAKGTARPGYRPSGGYCAPTSDRAPAAVPKRGQCPGGFAQSGAYCVEMRARR